MIRRATIVIGAALCVGVVGLSAMVWMLARALDDALLGADVHGSLYVYEIKSGVLTLVVDRPAQSVAWTPDSRSVWFTAAGHPGRGDHSVHQVDVRSHEISELFDIGSGGYVSMAPAGGLIAYARGSNAPLSVQVRGIDGFSEIIEDANHPKLDLSGGALRFRRPSCGASDEFLTDPRNLQEVSLAPQTPFPGGFAPDGDFSVSPNGRYLTYWKTSFGEVFLRDLETGAEVSLGDGFPAAAWAPDSAQFVFKSRPDGFGVPGTQVLQFISSDDGSSRGRIELDSIETRVDLRHEGDHGAMQELVSQVAWSPDGEMIAFGVAGGGTLLSPCGS